MQVLCKISNTVSDVRCKVCGQGFLVYWSRTSQTERDATRRQVIEALAEQHALVEQRACAPAHRLQHSGLERGSQLFSGGAAGWRA